MTSPIIYDAGRLNAHVAKAPVAEQQSAILFLGNLIFIHNYAQKFGAAIALADHTDKLEADVTASRFDLNWTADVRLIAHTIRLWREMAARDAVMTVYHFGKTLETLKIRNGHPSIFRDDVDYAVLKAAGKKFTSKFPKYERLRNSVAHSAEVFTSEARIAEHAQDGLVIFGQLEGRKYTFTNSGVHHELMLTTDTHATLVKIVRDVYNAFPGLKADLPPLSGTMTGEPD